jgi:hypothetical protein
LELVALVRPVLSVGQMERTLFSAQLLQLAAVAVVHLIHSAVMMVVAEEAHPSARLLRLVLELPIKVSLEELETTRERTRDSLELAAVVLVRLG